MSEILPKLSTTWTVADTQKWVQFTGLNSLAQKFCTSVLNIENLGIDGSILHSLTEDDFREELGVGSKIMLKKIMACNLCTNIGVQTGFNNFD